MLCTGLNGRFYNTLEECALLMPKYYTLMQRMTLFLIALCFLACQQTPNASTSPKVVTEAPTAKTEVKEETKKNKKKILFFGDSLTAGFGLDEQESFPSLIQDRIDSLNLSYEVINAGLSGETSAGGKGRIDWVLNQAMDIFVLELGANDVLRGLDLSETDKNLRAILDYVQKTYPETKLMIAGMEAPPNMGATYTEDFRNIYKRLAKDYNAAMIPFLLEGVAGIPDLNLGDAKHPNAKGQHIVKENVWAVLQPLL